MKKLFTIIVILSLITLNVNAQREPLEEPLTQTYIGFGTGISTFTGMIGAAANFRMGRQVFVEGGVGLGGWGYKYSFGLRYDFKLKNTFGIGVNYTGASGLKGMSLPMTLTNGNQKNVTLNCNPAATVDVKGRYSLSVGKKSILYFDLGYAIPMVHKAWEITDGSNVSPTDRSALYAIQPGGLLVGLGVLFGIN